VPPARRSAASAPCYTPRVISRILAFRPARVVERLGPRSDACPLSLRDLLGPALELGLALPVVRAPLGGVARGALVAAKELQSTIGLALPPGVEPEPERWFDAVTRAADEVAAGLPIFLSGEVVVDGEGVTEVERAFQEAWRLVDAGLTHLAVDVSTVAPGERGRVLADVAQAGVERGICLDVVLPLDDPRRALALVEELKRRGTPPDLVSVRCLEPRDEAEARVQVSALARICAALAGVPVMRRGPVAPPLLGLLARSPVKACEDGGAASARAVGLVPRELIVQEGPGRQNRLEQAAAELSDEGADRLEARAYLDAIGFMEALGTAGSASALSRALERRLEER
jgi:hypothetical protein